MAYTTQQVQQYLKDTYGLTSSTDHVDDVTAGKIYKDAQKYGVTANQVDSAMGWKAGTSQNWINATQKAGTGTSTGTNTGTGTGTSTGTNTGTSTGTSTSTSTTTTGSAPVTSQKAVAAPAPSFDIDSYMRSMDKFTENLVSKLKPKPITVQMPTAWRPSAADLEGISAESRIPGLLTGATAQQAADQAMARANSRGLLNSSMAVEGANNAMIANAASIASGDAGRYGDLLQTRVNNDALMQRLGVQGQLNERQSAIDQGYKLSTLGANLMGQAQQFGAQSMRDDFVYGRGRADQLFDREDQRAYDNTIYQRDRGDFLFDKNDDRWYEGEIYKRGRADQLFDRADSRGYEQTIYQRGRNDFGADRADDRFYNEQIYQRGRNDTLADRAEVTDTALQTAYAVSVGNIRTSLDTEIKQIQQSDLPADVKQGQINEAIGRARANLNLNNSTYKNMPAWKAEWGLLELDIQPGANGTVNAVDLKKS